MEEKGMKWLAKGKRGEIYTDIVDGKKVVIKRERQGSQAMNRIQNEGKWLNILNKHHIGPKCISASDTEVVMEYLEGPQFVDVFREHPQAANTKRLVKQIFEQCRILDLLKVDKQEMHNPTKHIIIANGKPVMIDFERCRHTENPKNVTQFCQFLMKLGMKVDKEEVKRALMEYKKTYDEKTYQKIIQLFLS